MLYPKLFGKNRVKDYGIGAWLVQMVWPMHDVVNDPNRYSHMLNCMCWRPVMHAQTWASYSAVYRLCSLSSKYTYATFQRQKLHQVYGIAHTRALLYDEKYCLCSYDHSVSLCDCRWPTRKVMCCTTKTMRQRESLLSPPRNTTCLKSASRVAFLLVILIYYLLFMLPS